MTPEQIDLVKASWQRVLPIADTAADLFYDTLFQLDPALRELFTGDLAAQKKKLMSMIGRVVASLDKLDEIVPEVVALGRRHVDYGVEPVHYDAVGEALLATLATGLGDGFDDPTREAWTVAYGVLAGAMIGAASERAAV